MPESARDALVNRQLPEMVLSAGSMSSKTPPTPSMPAGLNAEQKALKRFAVQGNAVITGGSGTLALHAARALLEHGVKGLALWDLNPSQSKDTIDQLRVDFPSTNIIVDEVNVSDADQVAKATARGAEQLGSIDTLCCFAGVVGCVPADSITSEEWKRTIDINTTGEFLCAQAVARQMISQGEGGSIVLVASISGLRVNTPQPQVAYNVSKAAVINLATSLAAEWAVHGIRVNSLSPGYMDTILNEGEGIAKARKVWADRNPMGRMGSPSELTGPLILLCSRYGGAYMTGSNLVVDGGQSVF